MIVGGGYAGFYTAWKLEKTLRHAERTARSASDDAAVPDLAAQRPGVSTVPNAQHAVRQGKPLARNLIATLRGRKPKRYLHRSLRVVATLGPGRGIFQFHGLVIKGFPAWLTHRGYHVLAVPTWERKANVDRSDWLHGFPASESRSADSTVMSGLPGTTCCSRGAPSASTAPRSAHAQGPA